jgi:glycosyl transferase family 25
MHISKVYYINLDERTDRSIALLKEMRDYGLDGPDQVVRFPAVKTNPGYIGCSLSHVGVLKKASLETEPSLPYVVVLEDDFAWKMAPRKIDETLDHFFSRVENWDVLVFAAPPYDLQTSESGVPGIRKCHKAQTTTGYMVRRGYIEKLISVFEESARQLAAGGDYQTWALDQQWKKLQETDLWFITVPGFGKQQSGFSDIEERVVDYPFV